MCAVRAPMPYHSSLQLLHILYIYKTIRTHKKLDIKGNHEIDKKISTICSTSLGQPIRKFRLHPILKECIYHNGPKEHQP